MNVNFFDVKDTYTVWRLVGCDILFCFLSEVPVANWAAQKLKYHFKNALQNIMTDRTPHSVSAALL